MTPFANPGVFQDNKWAEPVPKHAPGALPPTLKTAAGSETFQQAVAALLSRGKALRVDAFARSLGPEAFKSPAAAGAPAGGAGLCRLAFHRPPFNSVDHLHRESVQHSMALVVRGLAPLASLLRAVHAVCPPFADTFSEAHFRAKTAWAASYDEIVAEVAALRKADPDGKVAALRLSHAATHRLAARDLRSGAGAQGVLQSDVEGGSVAESDDEAGDDEGCHWID